MDPWSVLWSYRTPEGRGRRAWPGRAGPPLLFPPYLPFKRGKSNPRLGVMGNQGPLSSWRRRQGGHRGGSRCASGAP